MDWAQVAGGILVAILLIVAGAVARRWWASETVFPWERGLLYVDGRFTQVLEAGRHEALDPFGRRKVIRVAVNPQTLHAVYDVVSSDRLAYRVALNIEYEIVDPRTFYEASGLQTLSNSAQRAAGDAAAARSLDEALADRVTFNAALAKGLGSSVAGASITSAAVTTVTLPPELRRAYAEVEKARHEANAALERARGEQAALRSLANAARMLKDNPELMNLRLLQTLAASGKHGSLVLGEGALLPSKRK